MKPISFSLIVAAGLFLIVTSGWGAQGGFDKTTTPGRAGPAVTVPPRFLISGVDHVANGVALRNRCGGTIHLRGIAPGSTLSTTLLYWNYMDGSAVGASTDTVLFNGNLVTGVKTTDHPDVCWATAGDHTYRASVGALIPAGKPNGDYTFGALKCNDTSGANPWLTGSTGPVLWEGASLVATYRNSSTSSDKVAIFDQLSGVDSMTSDPFTVTMSTGSTSLSGSGLFTQVGADGQTGESFGSGLAVETDTFNGSLLAGPGGGPYPQSNWDGSDGWPMPELWDTHTLEVSLSGSPTNTDSTFADGDCVAAVVYVLQQGGF